LILWTSSRSKVEIKPAAVTAIKRGEPSKPAPPPPPHPCQVSAPGGVYNRPE